MSAVSDALADDILDNALDEFEDDLDEDEQDGVQAAIQESAAAGVLTDAAGGGAAGAGGEGNEDIAAAMSALMDEMKNPEFASTLEDTFKQLAAGGPAGSGANPFAGVGAAGAGNTPMDASVANTLKMLAETGKDLEGTDSAAAEAMGEEMMNQMMKVRKLGQKEDFQDIMDGMMRQLLSRDVMYDPMTVRPNSRVACRA